MKKVKHVVFIEYVTQFGGAPRSTLEFAERLSKHIKVTIIDPYGCCLEYREAVLKSGINYRVLAPRFQNVTIGFKDQPVKRVVRLIAGMPHWWSLSRRAVREIIQLSPDVVIGNNVKSLMLVAASLRLRKLPLIGYMRGWYTPDMLPPLARWLYGQRCHGLFAVSRATQAALTCSGLSAAKIHLLHNPIDVQKVRRAADTATLRTVPQNGKAIKILLPATLSRGKGQHIAVRALRHLTDSGHDTELWLAGNVGPGEDEGYVYEVRELAVALNVEDRVIWLGLHQNVPQLIKACDVIILPTYSEGLPRVLLEAMCLGKPVVASPVGGVLDLVLPGITGLLASVGDPKNLAQCIRQLLNNDVPQQEMIKTAQKYVESQFLPEANTVRALGLLNDIVQIADKRIIEKRDNTRFDR